MDKSDLIRLRHMLDASLEARSFVHGRSKADLDEDRMLVLALLKDIEILGEAASKIGDRTREEFPNIPWRHIIGMRNRLIHGYFDVNLDIVWTTVTKELPALISELEKIVAKGKSKL